MPKRTDSQRRAHAKYREANREKLRAADRARKAANYAVNGDAVRAESKRWRAANREKSRKMSRDWHDVPGNTRNSHLKYNYGMTAESWEALFTSQGSKCGACGTTDPKHKRGWHTDHDHKTGAVRGILCHRCNITLGNLGDSIEGVTQGCSNLRRYLAGSHNSTSLPVHAGLLFQV